MGWGGGGGGEGGEYRPTLKKTTRTSRKFEHAYLNVLGISGYVVVVLEYLSGAFLNIG